MRRTPATRRSASRRWIRPASACRSSPSPRADRTSRMNRRDHRCARGQRRLRRDGAALPAAFQSVRHAAAPHVKAACGNGTCFDQLGMVGIGVATKMGGKSLADHRSIRSTKNSTAVAGTVRSSDRHSCDSTARIDRPHLAARRAVRRYARVTAAANRLSCRSFRRSARSCRTSGHVAFLVHRLDHQQDRFMHGHGKPSELAKKFWYDRSTDVAALRCSCDTFGIDKSCLARTTVLERPRAHSTPRNISTEPASPPRRAGDLPKATPARSSGDFYSLTRRSAKAEREGLRNVNH